MKTIRFAELVRACGRPGLTVLWGGPEGNPDFQRALKAGRVLTVHQQNVGSKADFGTVGFDPEGPARFLVFPKSLKAYNGRRVVGIHYEALEELRTAHQPAKAKAGGSAVSGTRQRATARRNGRA